MRVRPIGQMMSNLCLACCIGVALFCLCMLFFSGTLHLCNDAREQKENEMESLKDLIAAQKLLRFEISQTKKAKELAAIEEKIDAIIEPAKIRAKKKADRIGYIKKEKKGKVSLVSEGKLLVEGKTAGYKVTLSNIKAHERATITITPY